MQIPAKSSFKKARGGMNWLAKGGGEAKGVV